MVMEIKDKIIKFASKGDKSVFEIAEKFSIPEKQIATLRRRVVEWDIKVRDMRGTKRLEW